VTLLLAILQADLSETRSEINIWFAIGFVLIVTAVAALVAAAGDRMGYRAARRKIRIGKLRPRTVSTLIAVITGVLISLVTFSVVFLVWSDFRNALLRYDYLNGENIRLEEQTGRLEQEIADAEKEKQRALAEMAAAQVKLEETITSQDLELKQKAQQITVTRAKVEAAQSQLRDKERQLASKQARMNQLEQELAQVGPMVESEQLRVEGLRELKNQLGGEIESLQTEIAALRARLEAASGGQQLIAVGEPLAYGILPGSQVGAPDEVLAGMLSRLKLKLSQRGLDFDPASSDMTVDFIRQLSLLDPESDYNIIVLAARNVFEGDTVLLGFDVDPIEPLVRAGTVLLDIRVGAGSARLTAWNGLRTEIQVPQQFDSGSLTDFTVAVQDAFLRAARQAGFLPDLATGEIESPVAGLVSVAEDLVTRPRPFLIQFVAKSDATALEGLGDASIHINQLSESEAPAADEPVEEEPPAAELPGDPAAPPEPDPSLPEESSLAPE
jgi:hypothetical protein